MTKITYLIQSWAGALMPKNNRKEPLTTYDEATQSSRTFPINFYPKNETVTYDLKDMENDVELNLTLRELEKNYAILREGSSYTNAKTYIFQGKNYQVLKPSFEAKEEVHFFYNDLMSQKAVQEMVLKTKVETKEETDVSIVK
jgi:hypothetical protein